MSPRLRLPLGALTTVAFVGLGVSFLADGNVLSGAVVLGLGVYRGLTWALELRRALAPDEEAPEPGEPRGPTHEL